MLLVSEKLATVHVSTHIALEEACKLKQQRIVRTIELWQRRAPTYAATASTYRRLRAQPPCRRAQPLWHPGLRRDRARHLAEARQKGMDCSGPHSPDTIFIRGLRGEFDLIVAMYHDQGHIPMKLIDFEATVNVSLGIPIIRTISVDPRNSL